MNKTEFLYCKTLAAIINIGAVAIGIAHGYSKAMAEAAIWQAKAKEEKAWTDDQ